MRPISAQSTLAAFRDARRAAEKLLDKLSDGQVPGGFEEVPGVLRNLRDAITKYVAKPAQGEDVMRGERHGALLNWMSLANHSNRNAGWQDLRWGFDQMHANAFDYPVHLQDKKPQASTFFIEYMQQALIAAEPPEKLKAMYMHAVRVAEERAPGVISAVPRGFFEAARGWGAEPFESVLTLLQQFDLHHAIEKRVALQLAGEALREFTNDEDVKGVAIGTAGRLAMIEINKPDGMLLAAEAAALFAMKQGGQEPIILAADEAGNGRVVVSPIAVAYVDEDRMQVLHHEDVIKDPIHIRQAGNALEKQIAQRAMRQNGIMLAPETSLQVGKINLDAAQFHKTLHDLIAKPPRHARPQTLKTYIERSCKFHGITL